MIGSLLFSSCPSGLSPCPIVDLNNCTWHQYGKILSGGLADAHSSSKIWL
jgi:hypothetical protein